MSATEGTTIAEVWARRLEHVPIAPPPGREGPAEADVGILEIRTAEGLTGFGLAPISTEGIAFVNGEVAQFLRGKDPLLVEGLWAEARSRWDGRREGVFWTALASRPDSAPPNSTRPCKMLARLCLRSWLKHSDQKSDTRPK